MLFPAVLFAVLMVIGCASAPDQTVQLTVAADALAASEVVLTTADQQHLIPASDRAIVAGTVFVAQKDLAAAQASLGQGAFTSAMSQVTADLSALVALRAKYQARPTTAPGK